MLVSQLPLMPVIFLSPSLRLPFVCFGLPLVWLLLSALSGAASRGQESDGLLGASSPCPWLGVAPWGVMRPGVDGIDSRVLIPLPRLAVLPRRRLDFLQPLFRFGRRFGGREGGGLGGCSMY